MKYAIIAAGEGSRLAKEGIVTPKPLVCLNGEPMLDRLIRLFAANNASSVSIIINEEMDEVYEHVNNTKYPVPLQIIRKSTPSSMHSFYELSHTLGNERFCLTTVDTVFREDEFSAYIEDFNQCVVNSHFAGDFNPCAVEGFFSGTFHQCVADGLFAVTGYIDDEKPLYVETDENMTIRGFYDENVSNARYVSGGVYCLNSSSIPLLKVAVEAGMSKMRNFQRHLLREGFLLKAWPFAKIIDVDRPDDIRKGADLIRN